MLIGISGRIGHGKDTFAKMIQLAMYNNVYSQKGASHYVPPTQEVMDNHAYAYHNKYWQIKKFATPLKQIACIFLGCTMEQLEDQDFKSSRLGPEWNIEKPMLIYREDGKEEVVKSWTRTVRSFLQVLGTEAIRGNIHDNAWVNALFSTYHPLTQSDRGRFGYPKWIITDVRFPNEAKAIKDRGGILVRINGEEC